MCDYQKKRMVRFICINTIRRVVRQPKKAFLLIIVTALLCGMIGYLTNMGKTYKDVVENTRIVSNFIGGLDIKMVPKILETGYISDYYYNAQMQAAVDYQNTVIYVTNDIVRLTGENISVVYEDGWDETVFSCFSRSLIVGEEWLNEHSMSLGQQVSVLSNVAYIYSSLSAVDRYRILHPEDSSSTDEEILAMTQTQEDIRRSLASKEISFTIVGYMKTDSGEFSMAVFAPGCAELAEIAEGGTLPVETAEFTLSDNTRANEYREEGKRIAGGTETSGVVFSMNTEKLEGVQRSLHLIRELYPAAVLVTLLIGAFICALVTLQKTREAAIMRIQGTSGVRTGLVLTMEHAVPSLIGELAGLAGVMIIRQESWHVTGAYIVFLFLYLLIVTGTTAFTTIIVMHKKVLNLLQTED